MIFFFDDDQDWHKVRPTAATDLVDGFLIDLISKRLAHLTWDRASGTKPSWGAFRIAWELVCALEVFASKVSHSRLGPNFAPGLKGLKAVLQAVVDKYGSVDLVKSAPLSQVFLRRERGGHAV